MSTSTTVATVLAEPAVGLIDEPIHVRLEGFPAHRLVEVDAEVDVPGFAKWVSTVTFVTDSVGAVDLDEAAPVHGAYSVPDASGLIWSLAPQGDSPRRPTSTRFLESGLTDYRVHIAASVDGVTLAHTDLVRQPVAPGVRREEIRTDLVVGTLFLPPGDGPFDVIVVVPGSNGGVPEDLPALYASHGYASLGLGYFGVPGTDTVPRELVEIPLEYFDGVLDWIEEHPDLRTDRLIFDGTSRGGELALLLGSSTERITAVIAWVPSLYMWRAFTGDPTAPSRSGWTRGGQPLPFIPAATAQDLADAPHRDGEPVKALADLARIPRLPEREVARIPVENIAGPVLLISGRDDTLWPSATFSDQAMEILTSSGFPYEHTHLSYPNAGHTVGPALGPTTVLGEWSEDHGHVHSFGGTAEGVARARRDLWPRVLDFVARHVANRRTGN
jgi:dienelactone hydrolase